MCVIEPSPVVETRRLALRSPGAQDISRLATLALEQRALHHVFFQALHLHADRRLGAVDHLGGAGKAAVIGNGDEGAQQLAVDAGRLRSGSKGVGKR